YDGANQHPLTTLGSISLSPHVSPDGSRLAFSSFNGSAWEIRMFSLDLNRLLSFPRYGGTNLSPAWAPDGSKLAFSSSRAGDPEIYVVDQSGANLHRLTSSRGADVSPVWNRKTGSEIAWVSGRTGLPQIYTMGRTEPMSSSLRTKGMPYLQRGRRMASSWCFRGYAITGLGLRELRTSTSWMWPASNGCN